MTHIKLAILFGFIFLNSQARADDCDVILQRAANQVDITIQISEYLNAIFDKTCNSSGETQSASLSGGYGGYTLGYRSYGTSASAFCRDYRNTRYSNEKFDHYKQSVSDKALDTYLECRKLAGSGLAIDHNFENYAKMYFTIDPPKRQITFLKGVDYPENIKCQTTMKDPAGTGRAVDLNAGTLVQLDDTTTIFCTRSAEAVPGLVGQQIYREAAISIGVSQGSYGVLWPKNEIAPDNLATELKVKIDTLNTSLDNLSKVLRSAEIYTKTVSQSFAPTQTADITAVCESYDVIISASVD